MSNFRPGNLSKGQPLGMTTVQQNLTTTATNFIVPGNISLLRLTSTIAAASPHVFTISSGEYQGQLLNIIYAGDNAYGVTLNSGSNINISAAWNPTQGEMITLVWDVGLGQWLEQSATGSASGAVSYQGTWNATTNTPTLVDPPAPTTAGDYYIVSVAGTQFTIDWNIGDWIVSNGSAWQKIDNTDAVTSVFGRTGAVVANIGDYTAAQVTNVPAGGVGAVTAQAAIDELDTEKLNRTLPDANIFVGDATNFAVGVALTGDIAITNAGVTSIAAGAIVDADVNGTAAIALTKLAAATASRALVSDASGFIVAATTTDTEIGYVNGVTSAIQTQLDGKATTALAQDLILVGQGTGNQGAVAMSGDATIVASGALTIAASAVTVSKCSRFVVAEATGAFTQAQIQNWFTTPVELVAAPGAGLYIVVEEVELFHDYATLAYAGGGIVVVEYGAAGEDILSFPTALVTGVVDQYFLAASNIYTSSQSTAVGGLDITNAINSNVQIRNLTAAFTDGNASNIIKYRVRYHVATAQV